MPITIGSNIASLNAQRMLDRATTGIASSFEQLSSGLRINKASDDAAGLSVSSNLRVDKRVFLKGIQNLNDGISAISIADGAISNLSGIVTRIMELAEQSSNGTFGSKQRASLDMEAQQLAREYFRIARTTTFNGVNLFDGSQQGLTLQAGYGTDGTVRSTFGGKLGTGTFQSRITYTANFSYTDIQLADLNGDGNLDLAAIGPMGARVSIGDGSGRFSSPSEFVMCESGDAAMKLADVNNDGNIDILSGGWEPSGSVVTTRLGNGNGTFKAVISVNMGSDLFGVSDLALADLNSDGNLDLVSTGNDAFTRVRLGAGNGTFGASQTYAAEASGSRTVSLTDLNSDGVLDLITSGYETFTGFSTVRLGVGNGTFGSAVSYQMGSGIAEGAVADINGDGNNDLIAIEGGIAYRRLGNGNGTFGSSVSFSFSGTGTSDDFAIQDLNGDGIMDLAFATGSNMRVALGNGNGSFRAQTLYGTQSTTSQSIAIGDLNNDGVLDVVTSGSTAGPDWGTQDAFLAQTKDGISPILPFSLKSMADSRQTLPVLRQTLERLSLQRGTLGAFQSRIGTAISVMSTSAVQFDGARSRIEDVDIADKTAELTRQSILQQTSSGVLAQANQAPALALLLLRSP